MELLPSADCSRYRASVGIYGGLVGTGCMEENNIFAHMQVNLSTI